MKKILTILACILSSSSFAAESDPPLSAKDTTNIIVAQNRQNQTLDSNKDDDKKVTVKDLKKAMTTTVVVTGNKSMSTEEINSVIKPYLKNTITEREQNMIEKEIQNLYTNKGYPSPSVEMESVGFSVKVMVTED
jgi:hemolysin activation/secretion protein